MQICQIEFREKMRQCEFKHSKCDGKNTEQSECVNEIVYEKRKAEEQSWRKNAKLLRKST